MSSKNQPPPSPVPREVTRALARWSDGSADSAERLLALVYDELRRLARSYLRRQRPEHTLQPTALVHEAYMRLAPKLGIAWQDRQHFYAVTARVMRGILVDHARARATSKRGGSALRVTLSEAISDPRATDLLALDDALKQLATFDARKARIIELRFFAGLSLQETAEVLEVSVPTVVNDTRKARAWLQHQLTEGTAS